MHTTLLFRYDCNAFPRLQLLRTRLYDFMEMANTGTQYSPHIRFICHEEYAAKQLSNVIGRFSVNGTHSKYLTKHDGCDSKLIVTVCILQPDTSGKLTRMDMNLLQRLQQSESEHDVNTVIYVIDTTQCTNSTLKHCSYEISKTIEPLSLVNSICSRLFQIESTDISVRISLYFEKSLLDTIPINITNINVLKNTLISREFDMGSTEILANGLLKSDNCQTFLRFKAVEYQWEGEPNLRLPWTVHRAKCKIKDHLCECLSKEIATTLVDHLSEHLQSSNVDFANEVDKIIDISFLKVHTFTLLFASFVLSILSDLLGAITALVALAYAFFYSVSVVDRTFRHTVADIVHESIMAKREELTMMVLQRFRKDFLKNIHNMCNVLNEFGRRNRISIAFHEFKTVTERNPAVKACGLFGNIIKIYIDETETSESIRKYLLEYNTDITLIHICKYREVIVKKYGFKSGNKIGLSFNSRGRYGTVSFPMKDKHNQYFCATCKHVTVSSTLTIETDDGITLPASVYFNARDFDFSLLKLHTNKVICKHGIRTEQDNFVSGEVLANDMLLNEDNVVYKWGATTGLTEGRCKGVICTKKIENGKYDIETFIIEGQRKRFSGPGDSGALVCIKPDSIVYTSYMAAFILIGELGDFDGIDYTNMHACYRVSTSLEEMEKDKLCSTIKPCF